MTAETEGEPEKLKVVYVAGYNERENCWFSNDRVFYCVEMVTSYEHLSRLDDPPFSTHVSSKKAFYPLTCDRSPGLRSTHAAPAALVARFASGNDFRDAASKISYVPRSAKIVTAQSKVHQGVRC